MKADIKQIHTITEKATGVFNRYLSDIVSDMQMDNLEVEIQYQFKVDEEFGTEYYSALIIGRGK